MLIAQTELCFYVKVNKTFWKVHEIPKFTFFEFMFQLIVLDGFHLVFLQSI